MTVKQLIEKLKEFPDDMIVVDGEYWDPIEIVVKCDWDDSKVVLD